MKDKEAGDKNTSQYAQLGIDAGKKNVRKTFASRVENDFPGAFVNIVQRVGRHNEYFTQHMDGDGSKIIQRILNYRETGNEKVFRDAVDDALSMNMGDIASAGFVFGQIIVTDVININGANVPKDIIMEQIAIRFTELIDLYRKYGFNIHFLGGETADLPDQVTTVVFDIAVYAEAVRKHLIIGNVEFGDKIWGFASDGQAIWEDKPNSGGMANGQTLARTVAMWEGYTKKYPCLVRPKGKYTGRFKVGDYAPLCDSMPVSELLISPTRQWAILIKILINNLLELDALNLLHGISMNTGGGATKIGHVGGADYLNSGILYRKEMPTPPPIFQIIQAESKESWRNMYETFNCGVGIDIVGKDDPLLAEALAKTSAETGIKFFGLGNCEECEGEENRVELITKFGKFTDY